MSAHPTLSRETAGPLGFGGAGLGNLYAAISDEAARETTAKAVKTAFHLINNFDLPPGSNNPPAGTSESYSDYTAWTTVGSASGYRHFPPEG